MLDIGAERSDRLTINPASPLIDTADLRPSQSQVHRICDRFQHLTHPHSSSFFSASLLASPLQTGRQHHHPARRSDTDPVPLKCCCSLRGLVSVGPFASTGRPLRQTEPSRHHSQHQRASPRLQHYYEPSDSSESIGLLFPHG